MVEMYNIIYTGEILPGFDVEQVQLKTKQLLKLSDQQVEAFFAKAPLTIKKNVPLEQANAIQMTLQSIGLDCKAECIVTEFIPKQGDNDQPSLAAKRIVIRAPNDPKPVAIGTEYDTPSNHHNGIENKEEDEEEYDDISNLYLNRCGRISYLNTNLLMGILVFGLIFFLLKSTEKQSILSLVWGQNSGWLSYILVVMNVILCITGIRRVHDCNLPAGVALLTILPIVSFIMVPVMCCVPGAEGRNKYGQPASQGSLVVTGVLGLISMVIWITWNISFY